MLIQILYLWSISITLEDMLSSLSRTLDIVRELTQKPWRFREPCPAYRIQSELWSGEAAVAYTGKESYYKEDNSGRCVTHHKLSISKNLGNMEEKFSKDIYITKEQMKYWESKAQVTRKNL